MVKNNLSVLQAKQWAVIIGVVLVVSVFGSLVGTSIGKGLTGNLIKDTTYGTVYQTTLYSDKEGPRIAFGQKGDPDQFMEIGTWNTVNNIDLKNRNLQISGGDVDLGGNLKLNTTSLIEFNGLGGLTELSLAGFKQSYSGNEGKLSIQIGGDNILMKKENSPSRGNGRYSAGLSPGFVSVKSDSEDASLSGQYLRFCEYNNIGNNTISSNCIYCWPNFETKTLDCR